MALLALLALQVQFATPAYAAGKEEPTVSQSTYEALVEAQKLITNGQPGKAAEKMNALLADVKGKAYEEALANQMLGYAHAGTKDFRAAAKAFRQALEAGVLPAADTRKLTYNLAQILINEGQYKQGLGYLEDWLKSERSPPRDARVLAAVAYYQSGNCNLAIPHLRTLAAETGESAERKKWSQALLGCYVDAKQYGRAAEILESMVHTDPEDNDSWMQLAAAYQQNNELAKATAVLELMLRRGALNEEQTLNLARMHLAAHAPIRAAGLLQERMKAGALARSRGNLELLLDSLLLAQEREQAVPIFRELLKMNPDGELYFRLGRIHFDLEQWPEAVAALQEALKTKGLKDPAAANLLLGIAAVHANQQALAERSLAQAARSKDTRDQAQWWLQRLQRQSQSNAAEHTPEG